jgi:hypothetical protein
LDSLLVWGQNTDPSKSLVGHRTDITSQYSVILDF